MPSGIPLVHHKPSNRARVRINGRDHWLGKWGSPESKLAYNRLIAEYLATRRIMPPTATPTATVSNVVISPASPGVAIDAPSVQSADSDCIPNEPTVAELASLYVEHCRTYYRTPDGKRTSTYDNALQAVRGRIAPAYVAVDANTLHELHSRSQERYGHRNHHPPSRRISPSPQRLTQEAKSFLKP